MLVGEKDRKFKSPTDGRLLNVTGRVYKLKDKGEGQMRIVLNAPIEALADLDASLSLLERIMSPNVEALNVLRVAIQKASEHCRRELKRRYATIRIDGTGVHAELTDSPFDDPATPGDDQEADVEFAEGEGESEDQAYLPPPAIFPPPTIAAVAAADWLRSTRPAPSDDEPGGIPF
jgi:hypothetical protein